MRDIKESDEYRLVKQLTATENREALKRTVVGGLLLFAGCSIAMHLFLNSFLWLLKY